MSDGSLTFHNITLFPHRFDESWGGGGRKQLYDMRKKQIISSLCFSALILNAFFIFLMRAINPDHIFLYNLIIIILSDKESKL
jgi:hypothetical protein